MASDTLDFTEVNFADAGFGNDFWMQPHDYDPESESEVSRIFSEIVEGRGLWDTLNLAEIELPGIWTASVTGGIDIQKLSPKGVSAARLEYAGYKPCEIELVGVLWEETQWVIFRDNVWPIIRPRNTIKTPEPIFIYHPLVEMYGVSQIVIASVSGPNATGDDAKGRQIRKIEIKALEFLPIRWKVTESGVSGSKNDKVISADGVRLGLEGMGHVVPAFGSDIPYTPVRPYDEIDYYGPQMSVPIVAGEEDL